MFRIVRKQILFLCITTGLIFGCGYQLRKPLNIDPRLQPVYVQGNSALALELKHRLLQSGVALTKSIAESNSSMMFTDSQSERRSLSLNRDGRDAEFMLRRSARFSWQQKRGVIVDNVLLRVETSQIANPDQPAAQRSNSQLVSAEFNQVLADQAMELIHQHQPQQIDPVIVEQAVKPGIPPAD